jgi:hypothetical protein
LLDGGDPVDLETANLPTYFTTHRWRGIGEIRAPDDDLLKLVSEHRKMRADNDAETAPIGDHTPFARDISFGTPPTPDNDTRDAGEPAEG